MKLRHHLFRIGARIVVGTGADRWLGPFSRGRGLILAFHHVCPRRGDRGFEPLDYLRITPDYLQRIILLTREQGFEHVSLDALPDRIADRDGPPVVAFTFDDGYRDNLEHAHPILSRHGVPWTLFVTPSFTTGSGRLWWLELQEAVARLDRVRVEIGGSTLDLPARSRAEKLRAFKLVYRHLLSNPGEPLLSAISLLARAADLDPAGLVRNLCLSWDELGELSRECGVTLGSHTLTHPSLAHLPHRAALEEVIQGRRLVEARLGIEVRHLAFPHGGKLTAGPREFAIAREAGFRTAVTTRPGHLFPEHGRCLHALPRIQVSGLFQTEEAIRASLSGVPFLLGRRGAWVSSPAAQGARGLQA